MRLLLATTILSTVLAAEKPQPKWQMATVVYVNNQFLTSTDVAAARGPGGPLGPRQPAPFPGLGTTGSYPQSVHQIVELEAEDASYTVEHWVVRDRMLRLQGGAPVQFAINGKDFLLRTPDGKQHKLKLKATYEKPKRGAPAIALLSALAADGFNGRWNITVPDEPRQSCWWLEVEGAGTPAVKGKFVGAPSGGLDVIPRIAAEHGELVFSFDKQAGSERKLAWRARLEGEEMKGTFTVEGEPDATLRFIGRRAPAIDEPARNWRQGKPVELFNGRGLEGWHARPPSQPAGWRVDNGLLNNANAGLPDLVTDATFWNFDLHAEYRIGKGSNSGVGLRGRYEVQIYDDFGQPPSLHGNGAVYSRIVPSANASRAPGEWQTLDIRLIGRRVTVVLNDQKVIDSREIEGLTAIALDASEERPGPIVLQGDHGPVEFRRIVLTPLIE